MKTIGLIGGLSWESTATYYRLINEEVKRRLGGLHSARLILYSVDFAEIEGLQSAGQWTQAGAILSSAAVALQSAGAECVVLTTNTMHKVADQIEAAVDLPFLHIADCTAAAIVGQGIQVVGLLGTRYTMEQAFYKDRLTEKFGLRVLTPPQPERETVHRIIYEELCRGEVRADSRQAYQAILSGMAQEGAEGIILGCTEISMLLGPQHSDLPLFDTAAIHALAAVNWSLAATFPS